MPEPDFPKPEGCVARGSFDSTDSSIGYDRRKLAVIFSAVCAPKRFGPVVRHHEYEIGHDDDPLPTIYRAGDELGRLVALHCVTRPNNPENPGSFID